MINELKSEAELLDDMSAGHQLEALLDNDLIPYQAEVNADDTFHIYYPNREKPVVHAYCGAKGGKNGLIKVRLYPNVESVSDSESYQYYSSEQYFTPEDAQKMIKRLLHGGSYHRQSTI